MSTQKILVLTTLLGLSLTHSAVAADSGSASINFKGRIVDAACNVTVSGTDNSTVELGQWPTSTFKAKGDTTIPQPFTLNVDDCTEGNFKFNFTGTSDSVNTQLLKVNGADGVGIAISALDSTSSIVGINTNPNQDSTAWVQVSTEGKASLPLQAFYQSTKDKVTEGEANATVRVTLQQK